MHYDPEGLKRAKDSGGYAPTFGDAMQEQQDAMYARWSAEVDVMVLTAARLDPPTLHILRTVCIQIIRTLCVYFYYLVLYMQIPHIPYCLLLYAIFCRPSRACRRRAL